MKITKLGVLNAFLGIFSICLLSYCLGLKRGEINTLNGKAKHVKTITHKYDSLGALKDVVYEMSIEQKNY